MKKIFYLLMVMCLSVSLVACGGNDESGNNDTPKQNELTVGEENTVGETASFKLFKINTTKKIEATMGSNLYYDNDNQGQTYVDVVLDYTNNSEESVNSEDLCVMTATTNSGEIYHASLFAVETNDYTYVSTYEEIQPLATARVHCAVSVPEDTESVKITLTIDGSKYCYDYTLSKTVKEENPIALGDLIGNEDYATVKFSKVEYTKKLLPSNTSDWYSYHEVDNNDNSFLAVKFEITNYLGNSKEADTFVSVKAKYMDKYTYTGFMVVEDTDQQGFSSYEDIDPLTTRTAYYLIEVPDTVLEKNFELTIAFNAEEYSYKQ